MFQILERIKQTTKDFFDRFHNTFMIVYPNVLKVKHFFGGKNFSKNVHF